ncbi:hypothetical protein [Infirmifilum sp. SLHALR2]|nr:MAG: hypothetical protein B7L53_06220 [Thermofilum sp. NZ13]
MPVRAELSTIILALLVSSLVLAYPVETVSVRKTIIRELDVLPGCGENTTITVTLVFDSAYTGGLTDLLAFATPDCLSATVPPGRVGVSQGFLSVSWENVELKPGDSIKYSVSGKNLFDVNVSLEADGREVHADCSRGYCYVVALKAHTINYTVEIEAREDLLKKQQLPISISWSIDPLYLYPISYSESPQSLRESGTEVSFQWTSFMNGSYRLSVVFEVRGENPWGEVLIPPPTVTVSLDPRLQASLIERYRGFTLKLLEENVGNLTAFQENVTALRDLLYNLSNGFDEEARLLENASSLADAASTAMGNAAAQLTRGLDMMNSVEARVKPVLENASLALRRAKDTLDRIQGNLSVREDELRRLLESLNITGLNLTVSEVDSLLGEARKQLSLFESEVNDLKMLVGEYGAVKSQLYAATENMRAASTKLRLMAGVLRESARKLRELAGGLRQAAQLIDSSLMRLSNMIEGPLYPDSFKQFNTTILSQRATATAGDKQLRTELMGDVVYVSLPLFKVKRSEPQVSNVSLEPATKKVRAYWPAVLAVLAAGAYFTLSGRKEKHLAQRDSAELRGRIEALKSKLRALEGVGGV